MHARDRKQVGACNACVGDRNRAGRRAYAGWARDLARSKIDTVPYRGGDAVGDIIVSGAKIIGKGRLSQDGGATRLEQYCGAEQFRSSGGFHGWGVLRGLVTKCHIRSYGLTLRGRLSLCLGSKCCEVCQI